MMAIAIIKTINGIVGSDKITEEVRKIEAIKLM